MESQSQGGTVHFIFFLNLLAPMPCNYPCSLPDTLGLGLGEFHDYY